MPVQFQVTFDCGEPYRLAKFWAAALGYEVEDFRELVDRLLKGGQITEDRTFEADGTMQFKTAAACLDPERKAPRLLFQVVPEGKSTKNRVHLDLNVGRPRIQAEVERLLLLGARRRWSVGEPGAEHCVTLEDPEGNEFCVQ
jgi:hypothetical protein